MGLRDGHKPGSQDSKRSWGLGFRVLNPKPRGLGLEI